MDDSPEPEGDEERSALVTLVGLAIVLALVAAIVLLAIAMLPSSVHSSRNPSSFALVIGNRWVIWLIRLCGLVVLVLFIVFTVYVARSIRYRMKHGHWLRSGGPFEAEIIEAKDELEDVEELFAGLADANNQVVELEGRLDETSQFLEKLTEMIDSAEEEMGRLREENAHLRGLLRERGWQP